MYMVSSSSAKNDFQTLTNLSITKNWDKPYIYLSVYIYLEIICLSVISTENKSEVTTNLHKGQKKIGYVV